MLINRSKILLSFKMKVHQNNINLQHKVKIWHTVSVLIQRREVEKRKEEFWVGVCGI